MAAIVLTDGVRQVVLENVPEERPRVPVGMEIMPDTAGAPVLYTKVPGLVEIPMTGRAKDQGRGPRPGGLRQRKRGITAHRARRHPFGGLAREERSCA